MFLKLTTAIYWSPDRHDTYDDAVQEDVTTFQQTLLTKTTLEFYSQYVSKCRAISSATGLI